MKGGILCIFQVNRKIYFHFFFHFWRILLAFAMYKRCWK